MGKAAVCRESGQGDSEVQSKTEHLGGTQAVKSADCEPPQHSPEQALCNQFPDLGCVSTNFA